MRVLWTVALVAGLWACKGQGGGGEGGEAGGPSPCDDGKLTEVAGALDQAGPDQRAPLALRMATELCPEPAGLAKSLQKLDAAPPDMRAMLMARAVQENPDAWAKACRGGLKVLQTLATVAPDRRGPLLWERCDLARFDFATPAEAAKADLLIPAVLYAPVLQASKAPAAVKRKVLRAMVGLK
ncbi:MAG: hypothetical protein H6702_23805 [Myxococcales bacterium]|nr:hypothetical protein [Myxococcales bacterium]